METYEEKVKKVEVENLIVEPEKTDSLEDLIEKKEEEELKKEENVE